LAAALATVIVLLVLDVLNAHPRIALTRVATHLNDELPDSVRVHASGLLEYHGRAHAFGLHAATCKLTSGDGHHIVQSALDGPISSTDGTLNVTMMVWVASSNLVSVAVADWQAGFTIECGLRLWVSVLGLSFAFPVTVTVKDLNRKGYDASMSEQDYQEDHLLAIGIFDTWVFEEHVALASAVPGWVSDVFGFRISGHANPGHESADPGLNLDNISSVDSQNEGAYECAHEESKLRFDGREVYYGTCLPFGPSFPLAAAPLTEIHISSQPFATPIKIPSDLYEGGRDSRYILRFANVLGTSSPLCSPLSSTVTCSALGYEFR
jgi:hypothetical protein